MAFSNTYDTTNTGSAVSNREDLSSLLTTLDPDSAPVLAMARKTKAKATFHEWTLDNLSDVNTSGIAEGADVAAFDDKFSGRARVGNYISHLRRPWKVSKLQNVVTSVGPADRAQAKVKAMKELRRDIEATIVSDNTRTQEDGAGTVYGMAGLGDILANAATSIEIPAAYRCDALETTGAAMTELEYNEVLRLIFEKNGEINKCTTVAWSALRQHMAGYMRGVDNVGFDGSGSDTGQYDLARIATPKGRLVTSATAIETDFGITTIVHGNPACDPSAAGARDRGYVLNVTKFGVAELLPMGSEDLEDQGGGPRGYVDQACTLVVDHPQSHGKIV